MRRAQSEGKFRSSRGIVVLLEESHELPLVNFEIVLRTGSMYDPAKKVGLTRLTARMIRMGSASVHRNSVEEIIDRLGAQLSIQVAASYVAFQGSVIARNIEPLLGLLGHLLANPAFRTTDLQKLKRETVSEIIDVRDNDRALAFVHFRKTLFGSHPYGRSVIGTQASIRKITKRDIIAQHRKHYKTSNLIIGMAGPIGRAETKRLVDTCFKDLAKGSVSQKKIPAPKAPKGRRVVIVNKPERTQSQIVIGTMGTHFSDFDHDALHVANAAFGGTFTARLMNEIRSKRGWSYGASSRLGHDRGRDAWWMWTFPELNNTVPCIRLKIELYEAWIRGGITKKELEFAKSYLINSYAFEIDTAAKRIDQRVTAEVMQLPADYYSSYLKRIRAVSLAQANAALKRRLSTDNLIITAVSTAASIERDLRQVPGLRQIRLVEWDDEAAN